MKKLIVFLIFAISIFAVAGKKERQRLPELDKVNTIFVAGNSQAADKAREMLREGKTCFRLAPRKDSADAVLEVNDSATGNPGYEGLMGGRTSIVSFALTLKSGDLIWSDSQRFQDAPFMSGSKTAAEILIKDLKVAAGCKEREKGAVSAAQQEKKEPEAEVLPVETSPPPPVPAATPENAGEPIQAADPQAPGKVPVPIFSDPPGASVFLNEKFIGMTPLKVKLAPGAYKLRLYLNGYAEWAQEVQVLEDAEPNITVKLKPGRF